jgi:DNA-binding beta-propeller fold protein YncE
MLKSPESLAVSPDGKDLYVAAGGSHAVTRLFRNPTTGAITQPRAGHCISNAGAGPCIDGHGLSYPSSVAVSPDGRSIYVASSLSNSVARLNRNPTTGAISQPVGPNGCISQTGAQMCADGHALQSPLGVSVTADGKSVYVASRGSDAVARFNRDPATGRISQPPGSAGCISETGAQTCANGEGLGGPDAVATSPDGKSVYVASVTDAAIARLDRNPTSGTLTQPTGSAGCIGEPGIGCAEGRALTSPTSVAVSPDGRNVYVASRSGAAVARLDRDTATGAISQPPGKAGCVSDNEHGSSVCAYGHGLTDPYSVAVSPDGKNVYAGTFTDGVARLDRNPATGRITQPAGSAGCISQGGRKQCASGHGLIYPTSVVVSPDANSVYVASLGSNAVAWLDRAP